MDRKILIGVLIGFLSCSAPILIETESGLQYSQIRAGHGRKAMVGDEVLIHEKMGYRDSLLFSSYSLPNPIKARIGGKQIIDGLDEGVRGMKEGEIRKMIIPPHLSRRKGEQTFPHPDSILVYEVELIKIID